jgi:hypothetical protein
MRQVEDERGLDLWIQTPSQKRLARAGTRITNEAFDDFGRRRPGGVSEAAKAEFARALAAVSPSGRVLLLPDDAVVEYQPPAPTDGAS